MVTKVTTPCLVWLVVVVGLYPPPYKLEWLFEPFVASNESIVPEAPYSFAAMPITRLWHLAPVPEKHHELSRRLTRPFLAIAVPRVLGLQDDDIPPVFVSIARKHNAVAHEPFVNLDVHNDDTIDVVVPIHHHHFRSYQHRHQQTPYRDKSDDCLGWWCCVWHPEHGSIDEHDSPIIRDDELGSSCCCSCCSS